MVWSDLRSRWSCTTRIVGSGTQFPFDTCGRHDMTHLHVLSLIYDNCRLDSTHVSKVTL